MFSKAWEWACPKLDIQKVTYFEAKPYRLYRMATDTSPKYEVEAVKNLKHKARTSRSVVSPSSYLSYGGRGYFGNGYCGQGSLWSEGSGIEDEVVDINDLYGVSELSDTEITDTIFNTRIELDQMSRGDPIRDEWKGYLSALYRERRRRNGRTGV